MMSRRDFIGLAAGAAMGWTPIAQAQPRDGMRRLGVLMGGSRAIFRGRRASPPSCRSSARLAGRRAAICASTGAGLAATPRCSSATRQSWSRSAQTYWCLARPGGNITGFSNYNDPLMAGKWLGMLTQIAPPVARVAVLYNSEVALGPKLMLPGIEEAARSLAIVARPAPCRDDAEIEVMMAGLAREERGGVLVLPDPFTGVHRDAIIALAARYRLPAVYGFRFFSASGGLMSYGPEIEDLFRRSAAYVDRILKGAKPSDLPVQMPTKFQLVINLKTAKALGVTTPPSLLAGADEVIE